MILDCVSTSVQASLSPHKQCIFSGGLGRRWEQSLYGIRSILFVSVHRCGEKNEVREKVEGDEDRWQLRRDSGCFLEDEEKGGQGPS